MHVMTAKNRGNLIITTILSIAEGTLNNTKAITERANHTTSSRVSAPVPSPSHTSASVDTEDAEQAQGCVRTRRFQIYFEVLYYELVPFESANIGIKSGLYNFDRYCTTSHQRIRYLAPRYINPTPPVQVLYQAPGIIHREKGH